MSIRSGRKQLGFGQRRLGSAAGVRAGDTASRAGDLVKDMALLRDSCPTPQKRSFHAIWLTVLPLHFSQVFLKPWMGELLCRGEMCLTPISKR